MFPRYREFFLNNIVVCRDVVYCYMIIKRQQNAFYHVCDFVRIVTRETGHPHWNFKRARFLL